MSICPACSANCVMSARDAFPGVFMDADYARIVDEAGAGPPFEPSLFVMATVVSVNRVNEVTVDAGTKALATQMVRRRAKSSV